jgi:SPP1 family predicted phage head-tail adaptor
VRAGHFDREVVIEQYTSTQDGYGDEIKAWAPLAAVWAAIEPLAGREYFAAKAVQSEHTVRVRTHYRDDVTTTMRVVLASGEILKILTVQPGDRRRELHLLCEAGDGNVGG